MMPCVGFVMPVVSSGEKTPAVETVSTPGFAATVNHSFPSGPPTMDAGFRSEVGISYSVNVGAPDACEAAGKTASTSRRTDAAVRRMLKDRLRDSRSLEVAGTLQLAAKRAGTELDRREKGPAEEPGSYCGLGGTGVSCPIGVVVSTDTGAGGPQRP